jgi:dihydrofolate reductase
MAKLRVHGFAISVDGFGAGPDQSLENPLGAGGLALHDWAFPTQSFRRMHGQDGGETGVDDDYIARGIENIGAWILGRNMFAPLRGPWRDTRWRGWWGENPPYHTPVFVLTNYPRPPLKMEGGTTFEFVRGDPADILERARQAADGRDVRLGGGVATLRAFLGAGLVDEMHLAVSPTILGSGESVFAGQDLRTLGYRLDAYEATERAAHYTFVRAQAPGTRRPLAR